MRWGWILAVLAAALLSLWALGTLRREDLREGPSSRLRVLSPEELLAATPETVLWESPSGRVVLRKIPSGEVWRSPPTSNRVALLLRGRGETVLPQGPARMGSEELLIAFQGREAEIRAQEDLSLLVLSTPLPEAPSDGEPQASGGLWPLRVVLAERFAQPLGELQGGLEGAPVFEAPTGGVRLLRLREAWVPDGTEDLVLYVVRGRLWVNAGETPGRASQLVDPGEVVLLPAGVSAELEPVREDEDEDEVLLVGFALSASPIE